MEFKELIKQLITLLAGFLFTALVAKYPNFPLSNEMFINLVIWIFTIMGIVNGSRVLNKKFNLFN